MNLPTIVTLGRVALAPVVGWLAFSPDWSWRATGFCLFVVAAVSDYIDGTLARTRNEVTDAGKLLDPLADKLLLACTLGAMYVLQAPPSETLVRSIAGIADAGRLPFLLVIGDTSIAIGLPFVVVAIVIGRELLMTAFRQLASRRGVMIAAIGPAKWKTGFQSVWVGAAYCWFATSTLARAEGWGNEPLWHSWALFNAFVGTVTMVAAVALTLWSLWLYGRKYGAAVFAARRAPASP